ncbi:MAG: hypothetical protein WCP55_17470, partial [Lentisphaerota bacterium]
GQMSNYYGYARSNYFRVKNLDKFKAAVKNCGVRVEPGIDRDQGKVALLATGESGWSSSYVDAKGNDVDASIHDIVQEHLADDEVAIFMEIGWENLRYLSGCAVAVNSKNESVCISLSDIYNDKRVKKLGKSMTRAEY